jgi:DNA (cytosine-5)-methyltransferase 1
MSCDSGLATLNLIMQKKAEVPNARALELFAGAGGLALAAKKAGISASTLIERDHLACRTLTKNQKILGFSDSSEMLNIELRAGASKKFSMPVDFLLGGPPCQPFSLGGQRKGHKDERDMFPVFAEFVHRLKPKAFVAENVAGLRSGNCLDYFRRIVTSLSSSSKRWAPLHLDLENGVPFKLNGKPDYRIYFKVLNAADFGVAQNRSRMFIVGIRNDIEAKWLWPKATHSKESLRYAQFVTKDYFLRHDIAAPRLDRKNMNALARALGRSQSFLLKPHRTVRDAIGDLPDPRIADASEFAQHIYIPGARAYPGHSGCSWDDPAKTIKAGVNGCPGGENMVRLKSGVRYFTVRELARLQGFPDHYAFVGTRNQCVRQIGNAVPVNLGRAVIKRVLETVNSKHNFHTSIKHDAAKNDLQDL